MSYIPDCRTDEYYNEKYLTEKDKDFIRGFDYCTEQADNLFNNLIVYEADLDIEGEDINLARFLENHPKIKDKFRECIKDWLEADRDRIIFFLRDFDHINA